MLYVYFSADGMHVPISASWATLQIMLYNRNSLNLRNLLHPLHPAFSHNILPDSQIPNKELNGTSKQLSVLLQKIPASKE